MNHLEWIRTLPCHCGDNTSTEAAHVRMSYAGVKANAMGKKPDNQWVVPLCSRHHQIQHKLGERIFWRNEAINPILYADLLWRNSKDTNKAFGIQQQAKLGNLFNASFLPIELTNL